MASEKITYLVTNYNNAEYVGECIKSIISQSNPNWECIIVDDCSSDDSMDEITKYAHGNNKIRIEHNDENIGQILSLIKMLEMTTTDIVGVVDSDDAIHPDTTGYVLNAYSMSSRIGMVYTNCIEYDENLTRPISIGQAEKLPFGPASSIVFGYVSSLRTYRKSCYYKTSGYDSKMIYAEDLDLVYKLEEVCLPCYVNKCLYKYRYVSDSRSRIEANRLTLLSSHKLAKLEAIKRRNLSGINNVLLKLFVTSEYKAKLHKLKNNKARKKLNIFLCRIVKWIVENNMYKTISVG